ncbi:hypothetical protein EDEG_01719 [Edhazardia aedis USNM 41457]|uniref:Protein transport protein BOS1 n=1 Tax=Edhazardia aedis (strain USNM 41457) TaxID=1003232 RepID=J9D878_EDHAE|nr:hypothetical protein EDEG_01719 [Edhazardia aedis USNM 41457]|eukprot:EJW03986.1 hypothetical protein EDEG_01719 [Edhazardia aedis USNM 41457]
MYKKSLDKLENLENQLKTELEDHIKSKDNIQKLNILMALYSNTLLDSKNYFYSNDENENNERRLKLKELQRKSKEYAQTIKSLNLKLEEEKKLQSDAINLQEGIQSSHTNNRNSNTEFNEQTEDSNDEFMKSNMRKMDEYIIKAITSLDSLKRQGVLLRNMRSKIESGLITLGLSNDIVENISKRYLNDYRCFVWGVAIFIALILLIKFL